MAYFSRLFCASLVLFYVELIHAEHVALGTRHGAAAPTPTPQSGFLSALQLRDELHMAISTALGAGHDLGQGRLGAVRRDLEPMWQSLAKNQHGRVDRRSLRYAVHRYLLKARGISVLGLEPLQQAKGADVVALFTDHAPAYVRTLLEGDQAEVGFSIDDAVATIAMLEELVAQQSQRHLEVLYADKGWDRGSIPRDTFNKMIEYYLLRWMMGNDAETIRMLESNERLLYESFDDWEELKKFTEGQIEAIRHSLWKVPDKNAQPNGAGNSLTWRPLNEQYSFLDAQAVAGNIALNFGSFWHTECVRVKESLLKLDYTSSGRVKLADFHGAALAGEWRFSESEEYLRQLGSLDESSSTLGPRVIVANYLQSASNCIVSEAQYRVCCVNECESHLAEIETAVQAPLATPEQIVAVVSNITTNLNDDTPSLTATLRWQLQEIANTHGGTVPLHGRLFLQWLHYVFPQDCSFPHKAGSVTSMSPVEYGDDYMASESELARNAAKDQGSTKDEVASTPKADDSVNDWMSQWSKEEELLTTNIHLHAPWETRRLLGDKLLWFISLVSAVSFVMVRRHTQSVIDVGGGTFLGKGQSGVCGSFGKAHVV